MADTIGDVILNRTEYIDVYSETGITVGSSIIIQNKTSGAVHSQLKATKPDADSTDGYQIVDPKYPVIIDAGASGCWCIGNGPISVQEA